MDRVERIAILIAEANNGGKWATHYTEEHKELWRARARTIIQIVEETIDEKANRQTGL